MGKTTDLLKKIRDTKGTFHTKIGTVKNRYSMDLTGSGFTVSHRKTLCALGLRTC